MDNERGAIFWIISGVAVATLVSGMVQLLRPEFVLGIVGGPTTAPIPYFFAIIGMFMAIFGALTLRAMFEPRDRSGILLWASVQKLGAAAAIGMGVLHQTFGTLALGVAAFDLVSGALMLLYSGYLTPRIGERR